jgi:hypothetical protein
VSQLDTHKVWTALTADPMFAAQVPPAAQAVIRTIVDALPETLAEQLGKIVALPSIMEAKLAVTERMLDSDFPAAMASAIPESARFGSVEEMAEMMTDALKMFRAPLMEMIHDTPAMLARMGVTERQLMADPNGVGLGAEALAGYDAGTLTVRELLETQPAVVLLNKSA